MSVKREDLIKAAKELNDVLGLDPRIKTGKKVTEKELSEQILEAAELILPEDNISEETMRVIKLLKGESVEDEEGEEVEAVEADEGLEDEEEEELKEEDAEEVEDEAEDEEEHEEDELKPAPKKEKKEKKGAKEGKPKAKKTLPALAGLTRVAAAALAVKNAKKPLIVEELVKAADELYVKGGGKPNLKESQSNTVKALQALIAFGVVEEKDGVVRVK
jgi:hypothetical protein